MSVVTTISEEETIRLGEEFASRLGAGDVVCLFGDLGSGKTRFAKGICHGLGVQEHIASPTFTLINEYAGDKLNVFHFDFYRLRTAGEIAALGFDEYLSGDGICIIEWAERAAALLPVARYEVHFKHGPDERTRIVNIGDRQGVVA